MEPSPQEVLLIGPFEFFLEVAPLLARAQFELEVAEPGEYALQRLGSEDFDAVLLLFPLPGIPLNEVLDHLRDDAGARLRGIVVVVAKPELREGVDFLVRDRSTRVSVVDDRTEEEVLAAVSSILAAQPRLSERLEVEVELSFDKGRAELPCHTRNISSSGLLVESNSLLAVGTHGEARVELPAPYSDIVCQVEVVRHTSPSREGVRRMGLRFVEFEGAGEELWNRFVQIRAPSS